MANLLLVEDDLEMCEELTKILSDEGYSVDAVNSGKEGIREIEKKKYNLLLLDLKIPDINGYEVLKFVKRTHPDIGVIVLTGNVTYDRTLEKNDQVFVSNEENSSIIDLADELIKKPFDVSKLLKVIRSKTT